VAPDEASDEQKKRAQDAFQAGDAAFDQLSYEAALGHFRDSYDAVASPNSRLMIARCLLELGRLDEAYDEFSGVAGDAEDNDAYEAAGVTAEKERAAVLNRLAWLTVELGDVPTGSRIDIGGRSRSPDSLSEPVALTPGHTKIEAVAPNGKVAKADIYVAAGRKAMVTLALGETVTVGTPPPPGEEEEEEPELEPVETTPPPTPPVQEEGANLKPWAFVAGGIGLAGGGAFAAFGILSTNHYNDLEDACAEDGSCPTDSQKDIDNGKQYQLFANIGLGVGIAGVATSALLFILDAKGKKGPVEVNVGYRSIELKGEF
jgi:hypothetical protein